MAVIVTFANIVLPFRSMKNKFITFLLRILQVLFNPKLLLVITFLMLLADYVLFKKLGDDYENKLKAAETIFTIGETYAIIGFSTVLVSKLGAAKWYKSILLLIVLLIISIITLFYSVFVFE